MNTAATEIQGRHCRCFRCDGYALAACLNEPFTEVERIMLGLACKDHGQLRCELCLAFTEIDRLVALRDSGEGALCNQTHAPHVYADCYSCMKWCVAPNA